MGRRSAVALGHLSFQIRQFASHHDVFSRESGADPTTLALFEPSRDAADNHAHDENHKSHKIERNRHGKVRIGRIERVEGHRDRLVIGDRQRDQRGESRDHEDYLQEPADHRLYAHDHLADHLAGTSICGRFRRSRISLPVLKNGTDFWSTATCAPVLGLRPARARRFLTEKAPKPRNSTRSPRASAATISPRMALTIFSTSRW